MKKSRSLYSAILCSNVYGVYSKDAGLARLIWKKVTILLFEPFGYFAMWYMWDSLPFLIFVKNYN